MTPSLLLTIFIEFFSTGLFSIGGGLATLPFLFKMSDTYGWFTHEQLTNMIAISESTPGPIGVNIATYVGYTIENAGLPGAIFTTLSLVLPSLIVILIIAGFLTKFKENKTVKTVFYGIRPAVIGLLSVSVTTVLNTAFDFSSLIAFISVSNLIKLAVFALMLFGVFKFKKHPIVYIAIGALIGIIFKF